MMHSLSLTSASCVIVPPERTRLEVGTDICRVVHEYDLTEGGVLHLPLQRLDPWDVEIEVLIGVDSEEEAFSLNISTVVSSPGQTWHPDNAPWSACITPSSSEDGESGSILEVVMNDGVDDLVRS